MQALKPGFWYMASPYSHPSAYVRDARARAARDATYGALRQGYVCFSPIHATHDIAVAHSLPKDAEWWKQYNARYLDAAAGVIVLMLDGWRESVGVKWEIEYADRSPYPLPVLYMDPTTGVIRETIDG